jgi:hypothetical protein
MRRILITSLAGIILFLLVADYASAQVYKGVVLDEATREPVPYVTVSLQNQDNEHVRHTSSDEDGTFLLVAPDVTDYFLHVKRIGYSENSGGPFLVETGDTLSVQFRIMETTESLGEVTVEGTPYEQTLIENYLKSKNFYTRKNRGLGVFMTKNDIEEKHANFISDLFRSTHGIQKVYSGAAGTGNGIIVNKRQKCAPKLVVNGLTLSSSTPLVLQDFETAAVGGVAIDNYASIENLVGVEVYTGIPGQPAEFGPKSYCGAVVLWTR